MDILDFLVAGQYWEVLDYLKNKEISILGIQPTMLISC